VQVARAPLIAPGELRYAGVSLSLH
jgi:hypothetical protein